MNLTMHPTRALLALLTLLCAIGAYAAPSQPALPLEVYANPAEIGMMRLSPDGKRYAYRLTRGEKKYLVVKEFGQEKPIGAIDIESINPRNIYFIDKNRLILRAYEYTVVGGFTGKHNVSMAWVYDLQEQKVRQLLFPGYGIFKGQGGLGKVVGIMPEQNRIFMPAYIGDMYSGADPIYTLTSVRLDRKSKPRKMTRGAHDATDFFVDENGELIAQEYYSNKNDIHRVQARQDGRWVTIFEEKAKIRKRSFVGLPPDRSSLVMLKTDRSGRRNYFTMSLTDGTISKPLFQNKNADVEAVMSDLNRVVYGVRFSGFHPSYAFFDPKIDKLYQDIQKSSPSHSFTISDHTPDWSKILFYVEGKGSAGDYMLYENGGFSFVDTARRYVHPSQVHPVIATSFQARDDLTIPTLLTYPNTSPQPAKKLPTAVYPHGGPASYDKIRFNWMAQYLASRGFLVIQPQFRGSRGFGRAHRTAGNGEWGKKMQHDITDAVKHYIAAGEVDPDRICIIGASYGGYAALAGGAFTPDLYQCVVSINGVSGIPEMLEFEEDRHNSDSWVLT
ncbi:prolyl oligopeptidase [Neiella marina]|uniref:Prolyl oligopeptidase n=1 Tax=Neiella marina TaxID=508461 RepID=A0A8J2XRF8_9GAMM|nr:prolyl oligopeptidase [Neiella marina]